MPFEIGRAALLRDGADVTLIAAGVMVTRALEAAALLAADGISAAVLNMSTIRPIDRERVIEAPHARGPIVTVEEHTVYGGLGGAVAEVVVDDRIRRACACSACRACSRRPAPPSSCSSTSASTPRGIRDAARTRSWQADRHGARPHILAIDQGTTNTKVLVVDDAGAVVARASRPVADRVPAAWMGRAGRARDLAKRRGRASRSAWPRRRRTPDAVAVTNQRESVLVWERRTGRPLGPCIVWQCRRTAAFCDDAARARPRRR